MAEGASRATVRGTRVVSPWARMGSRRAGGRRTDDERLRAAGVGGQDLADGVEVERQRVRRVAVRVERRAAGEERMLPRAGVAVKQGREGQQGCVIDGEGEQLKGRQATHPVHGEVLLEAVRRGRPGRYGARRDGSVQLLELVDLGAPGAGRVEDGRAQGERVQCRHRGDLPLGEGAAECRGRRSSDWAAGGAVAGLCEIRERERVSVKGQRPKSSLGGGWRGSRRARDRRTRPSCAPSLDPPSSSRPGAPSGLRPAGSLALLRACIARIVQ